jgi:hypothetical protein
LNREPANISNAVAAAENCATANGVIEIESGVIANGFISSGVISSGVIERDVIESCVARVENGVARVENGVAGVENGVAEPGAVELKSRR